MVVRCSDPYALGFFLVTCLVGCGKEVVEQKIVVRPSSGKALTTIAEQNESNAAVGDKMIGEKPVKTVDKPNEAKEVTVVDKTLVEKSDSQRIIGTWSQTTAISDGKDTSFGFRIRSMFSKDTFLWGDMEFTYRLDPTTNPKQIDFYPVSRDETGAKVSSTVPQRGVYRLDGDVLQICHNMCGSGPRPVRFEGLKGDGNELLFFERIPVASSPDDSPK